MIRRFSCFGRSNNITNFAGFGLAVIITLVAVDESFGFGIYPTRIKCEYQYSDYNSYKYPDPVAPIYPDTEYVAQDPHIADFPENRGLVRLTQALGPLSTVQLRYQYSELSRNKEQQLLYGRYAQDVTDMTNLYCAYQLISQPDVYNGHMFQFGARHDRSGWIVAESAFSYLTNKYDDGNVVDTYSPMFQLRYSLDSYTALLGRWEGFWSTGDNGNSQSYIYTAFISRYLPSKTALHLGVRYYSNDIGVWSLAPTFEVAQYILWNLTLRASYRYYENSSDDPETASTIDYGSIRSHSGRIYIEWEMISDVKLHFKLRRYDSNQGIQMNTYLLGFEYMI